MYMNMYMYVYVYIHIHIQGLMMLLGIKWNYPKVKLLRGVFIVRELRNGIV